MVDLDTATNESPVRAVLIGGPVNLPEDLRTQAVSRWSHKIKVAHYGGYEHFERRAEPGAAAGPGAAGLGTDEEVQFHWTMRTAAAE